MPTSLVVKAGSTSHKLALLELTFQERLPCLWQARIDWGGAQAGGLLRWRWEEEPWQQATLSLDHGRRDSLAGWLAAMLPTLTERFASIFRAMSIPSCLAKVLQSSMVMTLASGPLYENLRSRDLDPAASDGLMDVQRIQGSSGDASVPRAVKSFSVN